LNIGQFTEKIFNISSTEDFNELALQLFHYQYSQNDVYRSFVSYLIDGPGNIKSIDQIPFLPISFFKTRKLICENFEEEAVFASSGTGGERSKHYIYSLDLYRRSFMSAYIHFFGPPEGYRFLGLLPSYLEKEDSSLVYMVNSLMQAGQFPESGFYLDEFDQLATRLEQLSTGSYPTVLIGVSFALLDFAEKYPFSLGKNIIIMETGGMKGRREEITREDLHARLGKAFDKEVIYSEYGMTELLSQAYSKGHGRFSAPPWMKVMIRDIQDPFSLLGHGQTGAINIIDLANIHSCAFIETQDIGRTYPDGTFEVLGRTDVSDIRGCNLLLV
jgi:phenylacetate-coenzyme A ligase PaaK-like adenylate-forming protein